MKARIAAPFLVALLIAVTAVGRAGGQGDDRSFRDSDGAPPVDSRSASVPGELIVRFSRAADGGDRAAVRSRADVRLKRVLPLPALQLVEVEGGHSRRAAEAELERSGLVAYAEPNYYRRGNFVPDDSYFRSLWGLSNSGQIIGGSAGTSDADIDAPEAWERTTGSVGVTAAVVDSGVDAVHPDLVSQRWANADETGSGRESNGVDDDGNGFVDDARGWDWVDDDKVPADENGHGTHVAGTLAASGNNGRGVAGVSWRTRLMPLRVLDADGWGTVADLVSAYRYAASEGARIVNLSLGGGGFSQSELDAISGAPNTLFVAAAGNGGQDGVGDDIDGTPEFPCAYRAPNVVCVAASDHNDRLASFSNYGATSVHLAAPGLRVLSTLPGDAYAYYSGTSMATPHVAGAAALLWALDRSASLTAVRSALLLGADAKQAFVGRTITGGRLNAERSVRLVADTSGTPTTAPAPAPVPSPSPTPAPTTATPKPAAPRAPVLDRTPPVLTLRARRRRLRSVLARGLLLRARCSERCTLRVRVLVDGRTARRVRLSRSRRPVTVGRAVRRVTSNGNRIIVKFSRRARRRLKQARRVKLTIRGMARDAAGNNRYGRLRVRLRR